MSKATADDFQNKYGDELARAPLNAAKTARMLKKALLQRQPPIDVPEGVLKTWFKKYSANQKVSQKNDKAPKMTADAFKQEYGTELTQPPIIAAKRPRMMRKALVSQKNDNAPKMTADAFQQEYGTELTQPPLSEAKTPRMMRKALLKRQPPVNITDAVCKTWFMKHYRPQNALRIIDAKSLEQMYGDSLRMIEMESHGPGIAKALAMRTPQLYAAEQVIGEWRKAYAKKAKCRTIDCAEKLEVYIGNNIRSSETSGLDAHSLCQWLRANCVSTTASVCDAWKATNWSLSLKLTTSAGIEAELGEYLRQPQLKTSFADNAETEVLAKALAEQRPAIFTNSLALARWHAEYQQDSLNKNKPDEQASDENQDGSVCKRRATSHA